MSRINRRNWTTKETDSKSSGGMFDLFDNLIKEWLRINDAEYDYMLDKWTDEEMSLILNDKDKSFKHGRQVIQILNKYIDYDQ